MVGMGFLADAYDLFVIDMVMSILHRLHPGGMGANDKSMVASATLVGAIIGQVSFGLLGDWIGRRWTFMATCVLIIMGAVLSGCVTWGGPVALVTQLALCRFCLGVGVGGEYPLAATIAAEGASFGSRGRLIAAIFSMQGWGSSCHACSYYCSSRLACHWSIYGELCSSSEQCLRLLSYSFDRRWKKVDSSRKLSNSGLQRRARKSVHRCLSTSDNLASTSKSSGAR